MSKFILRILDYMLTISTAVFILACIPVVLVVLIGFISFVFAAILAALFTYYGDGPVLGFAAGMVLLIGVALATLITIVVIIFAIILAVTFVSLPTSLVVKAILRQKKIKSQLIHIFTYSFFGGFVGSAIGVFAIWFVWKDLREFQYSWLAIGGLSILSILFGILSVNICGITLSMIEKIQNLFDKWKEKRKSKLALSQASLL